MSLGEAGSRRPAQAHLVGGWGSRRAFVRTGGLRHDLYDGCLGRLGRPVRRGCGCNDFSFEWFLRRLSGQWDRRCGHTFPGVTLDLQRLDLTGRRGRRLRRCAGSPVWGLAQRRDFRRLELVEI